jgi:hypothetical protein
MIKGITYALSLYIGLGIGWLIGDFVGAAFGLAVACFIISGIEG